MGIVVFVTIIIRIPLKQPIEWNIRPGIFCGSFVSTFFSTLSVGADCVPILLACGAEADFTASKAYDYDRSLNYYEADSSGAVGVWGMGHLHTSKIFKNSGCFLWFIAQVLGVEEHAPLDEVNRAYKRLSLVYHPDKTKGMAKQQQEDL